MPKIALVLVPPPDDAEFYAGGTIAQMARAGARVVMVIATDGRKGSFEHDGESLARLRSEEALRAAKVMGAEPPIGLGHPDMELDRLPAGQLREQFVREIRRHKPDLLIAQDPFTSREIHPDHRAVAWAASEAAAFASLPLLYPEHSAQGLEPHFVVEKYFYTDSPSGANKIVDVSDTLGVKLAALAEHKSQMTFLVEDVFRQARLAGLDVRTILGEAAHDPMAAMTWAMEMQAAEVGGRIGVKFGEAFRYERFHPLVETLLAGQT